jgi:hypothetical protein
VYELLAANSEVDTRHAVSFYTSATDLNQLQSLALFIVQGVFNSNVFITCPTAEKHSLAQDH